MILATLGQKNDTLKTNSIFLKLNITKVINRLISMSNLVLA